MEERYKREKEQPGMKIISLKLSSLTTYACESTSIVSLWAPPLYGQTVLYSSLSSPYVSWAQELRQDPGEEGVAD